MEFTACQNLYDQDGKQEVNLECMAYNLARDYKAKLMSQATPVGMTNRCDS